MGRQTEDTLALVEFKAFIKTSNDDLVIKESALMSDESLMTYVRCRKYDLKSAYTKLKNYIHARATKHTEFYRGLHPNRLEHITQDPGAGVLRHRDPNGCHVAFARAGNWDTEKMTLEDLTRVLLISAIETHRTIETQKNGFILLIDCKGFSVKHAKALGPTEIAKYADIVLNACPYKFKAFHLVNVPMMLHVTLNLIKMVIPNKIRKRIYTHGYSMPSLHKHFDPATLPSWLGGSIECDEDAVDMDIKNSLAEPETLDFYTNNICNV